MQGTVRRSYQNRLKTNHGREATLIYSLEGLFEKSGPRLRRWLGERAVTGVCETANTTRRVSGRRLRHYPNAHYHPWPNSFQKFNLSFLWEKEKSSSTECLRSSLFLYAMPFSATRLSVFVRKTNNHTAVRYAS